MKMSEKFVEINDEESQPLTGDCPPPSRTSTSPKWLKLWTILNTLVTVSMVILAWSTLRNSHDAAPYSPIRRDGQVKLINKRYKPSKEFQQSLNSKQADEAWDGWIEKYDRMFKVTTTEAKDTHLPHTIERYKDEGYSAYSLGVYHQMHCLNRIRKAMFPGQYFANETKEDVLDHTVHCFDVIRQSLLCHSDISIVYWWNRDWTTTDKNGDLHFTEKYNAMSPKQRQKDSFAVWDTTAQCRDFDAIHNWVLGHELDLTKYDESDSLQHQQSIKHNHGHDHDHDTNTT